MNEYIEKIVDVTTGEEILRPYTEDEITIAKEQETEKLELLALKKQQEQIKRNARIEILSKLGLTDAEIELLFA